MKRVLIIDDEPDVAALLARLTERAGFTAQIVGSVEAARAVLADALPDLVLLDLRLPDGSGLDYLPELKHKAAGVPVIMVTGEGEVDHAVRAMRAGAADFLLKPVDIATLTRAVKQATSAVRREGRPAQRPIIGESASLQEVWRQIDLFAPTDITVILLGESGTGKELFARALHERSKRADGPFIELDCASIAPTLIESELFGHEKGAFTDAREARAGKFELASGGTLFLDEIGNLSLGIQAKLLRVVQERQFRRLGGEMTVDVDVRIVAATNLDLEDAVRRGAFRNDLYFRLAELPLSLPALRDRPGDVRRLVEHFVADFASRFERAVPVIEPAVLRALEAYSWPGNVRELLNVVRVAVLRSTDRLGLEALPPGLFERSTWTAVQVAITAPSLSSSAASPVAAGTPRHIPIPWPQDDQDGLDLKRFLAEVRAELEREILTHLSRSKLLSKAAMARYLKLDYKVLVDKLKLYGLSPSAPGVRG